MVKYNEQNVEMRVEFSKNPSEIFCIEKVRVLGSLRTELKIWIERYRK